MIIININEDTFLDDPGSIMLKCNTQQHHLLHIINKFYDQAMYVISTNIPLQLLQPGVVNFTSRKHRQKSATFLNYKAIL